MNYQKILLSQIPEEGLVINLTLDSSELSSMIETDTRKSINVKFKGMIQHLSGQYLLSGRVKTFLHLSCDRCLEQFEFPVNHDFILYFVVRKDHVPSADISENDHDDEIIDLIDNWINIEKILLEQIVLQIPMKALCSDSCRGLCSQCGQNLNVGECGCDRRGIDPRLLKLKDLLEK
ncbi:DUF177 domain-containing protein [bacterium]|nr:DUF177 domain-containing protein [bacterium]